MEYDYTTTYTVIRTISWNRKTVPSSASLARSIPFSCSSYSHKEFIWCQEYKSDNGHFPDTVKRKARKMSWNSSCTK